MARSRAVDRGLTLSGARIFYRKLNPLRYRGTSERRRRCQGDTGIAVSHQRRIPMKLSPTVLLALAFAAGIAGAAMAQNSAVSGTASTSPQTTAPMPAGSTTSQGQSSYAQPQQNAAQTQSG